MNDPNVILAATDFSDHGSRAVDHAIELANQHGAKLHIAHVFAPPLPFAAPYDLPPPDLYLDQARKECESQLSACSTSAAQAGIDADTHLLSGSTSDELCSLAGEIGAELVVVGSRGLTGLSHMLLGSVAERIVRHAPCSVLVARPAGNS